MARNAAYLLSIALMFSLVIPCGAAFADEPVLTALELQQQIEERQADYAAARAEADAAAAEIDANLAKIEALEREVPKQRERSARAARELYKMQQQGAGIVDLLLGSDSFGSFLAHLEYVNKISDANVAEMNRLARLEDEITAEQDRLKEAQAQANARAEDARSAMVAAQEAQAEVQRRIEEEARLQAEAAATAAALAEEPRDNDQGSVEDVVDPPADDAKKDEPSSATQPEPEPQPAVVEETVEDIAAADASSGDWAARIDAYLAGSPLAGQGATFANAAAAYGVDPRLSPAIACVESGKGAVCFKPHNAWGWGSSSWKSWEEAIDAHVGGLARGYGGQLTKEGAKKYCPPNWKNWYNNVKAQMEMI